MKPTLCVFINGRRRKYLTGSKELYVIYLLKGEFVDLVLNEGSKRFDIDLDYKDIIIKENGYYHAGIAKSGQIIFKMAASLTSF